MSDTWSGRYSRRDALRLAGAAGLGAAGASALLRLPVQGASRPSAPAHPERLAAIADGRVRVGYLPITDASPLLLAHALGMYEEAGLEVERPTLFRGWSPLAEAFQAGQVDVVHLLMPMTIWLRFANQVPLTVVAWDHMGGSALTVAPEIEGTADLAGRSVAIPFWYSIHNVILQMLLREAGLLPILEGEPSAEAGTVKLIVLPPPDMPPALAAGSIAGYIVADPFNAVAEVNAVGRVLRFTGDVWLDHACCVVTMTSDLVAGAPDVVQAVVDATARAQLWAGADRSEAARILSTDGEGYLPQPRPAIERALSHYDLEEYGATGAIRNPDWPTGRIDFQPFPFPSYTELLVRSLAETAVEGDASFLAGLDPAAVHGELVDDRFARSAIASLGGPAAFGLPADLDREEVVEP
jgi:NitT/TauT family transport system substrate-binding protein